MTHYPDVAEWDYYDRISEPRNRKLFGFAEWTPYLRAVGWLDGDHAYKHGEVDPYTVAKLRQLIESRTWEPTGGCMGGILCPLCDSALYDWSTGSLDSSGSSPFGVHNLFVPGHGVLYVSPELIRHYISSHSYQPPIAFCDAVKSCPPIWTWAYAKAVRRNGPPAFKRLPFHRRLYDQWRIGDRGLWYKERIAWLGTWLLTRFA
jgi:hypothetical protein